MSAAAIEAGRAYVTVSVKGTKESVDKMTTMVQGMSKTMSSGSLKSALIGGLAGGVAGVVGQVLLQVGQQVGKIITSVVGMIRSSLATIWEYAAGIADVVKMADRLGTSVEFVSQMRTVVEDSGATMADFESSMKAFQRNMFTASTGVGEAKGAFEELEVDPMALSMMSLEEAVMTVVKATDNLATSNRVGGVMMRIMGENAEKMIPFIQGNTELFEALAKQSTYLGRTLDNDGARGVDNMRDSWVKLGRQLDAIWEKFVMALAPTISWVIDGGLIPLVRTIMDMTSAFDDSSVTGDVFRSVLESLGFILVEIGRAATQVGLALFNMFTDSIRMVEKMLKLYADFWELTPWEAEWADNAAGNIGKWSSEMERMQGRMQDSLGTFWDDFERNQEEWAKLTAEERAATKSINDGFTEEVTAAAEKIADVFGGEALQRNASTMQKLQEMAYQNNRDIKEYVKKIHHNLSFAPVVRGTL